MSNKVVEYAFLQPGLSNGTKLVLVKLADFASSDGRGFYWNSALVTYVDGEAYDTKSKEYQSAKRRIQRSIAELQKRGLLKVEPQKGQNGSNRFRILKDGQEIDFMRFDPGVFSRDRAGDTSVTPAVDEQYVEQGAQNSSGVTPVSQKGDTSVTHNDKEREINAVPPKSPKGDSDLNQHLSSGQRAADPPVAGQASSDVEESGIRNQESGQGRCQVPGIGDQGGGNGDVASDSAASDVENVNLRLTTAWRLACEVEPYWGVTDSSVIEVVTKLRPPQREKLLSGYPLWMAMNAKDKGIVVDWLHVPNWPADDRTRRPASPHEFFGALNNHLERARRFFGRYAIKRYTGIRALQRRYSEDGGTMPGWLMACDTSPCSVAPQPAKKPENLLTEMDDDEVAALFKDARKILSREPQQPELTS